jgi:1,4-alpha-glucan branching enzyme
VDFSDWQSSIISFLRKAKSQDALLVVCNFTPVPRNNYRIGAPQEGAWEEVLNSDSKAYGGSGYSTIKTAQAIKGPLHNQPYCLCLNLPPLAIIVLKKKPSQTSP